MCPTECVGDISGEAASSVEINKGIGGRRAAVTRLAAMVVADIKKGAAKTEPRRFFNLLDRTKGENEGEQQIESEREKERRREEHGRA